MVLEQRRVDPYIATGKRSRGLGVRPHDAHWSSARTSMATMPATTISLETPSSSSSGSTMSGHGTATTASRARSHWDHPGLRYRLVERDTDLLPGVSLVEISGHTIGHQSVLVRLTETGPRAAGDRRRSDGELVQAGREAGPVDEDADRLRASTPKLLDLAQREHVALIVFHHDGRQWEQLKKAPDYYE